jgi:hypothetical protein
LPGIRVLENQRTTFTRCFDCAGAEYTTNWTERSNPTENCMDGVLWLHLYIPNLDGTEEFELNDFA